MQIPEEIVNKIFLMAIETGHAQCIKQYLFDQHKINFCKVLNNLKAHYWNFKICNPITGQFRPGYESYNALFEDNDIYCYGICPSCYCFNQTGEICYNCQVTDF